MNVSNSKNNKMVIHNPSYLIKLIRGRVPEAIIDPEIPKLVMEAADEAIKKLKLEKEYIVILIVPGDHVTGLSLEPLEEDEDESEEGGIFESPPEHSIYMQTLDTIVVAGIIPDGVKNRDKWLISVRKSVLQDFILHWTYTQGGFDEDTKQTEAYLDYVIQERLKEFEQGN